MLNSAVSRVYVTLLSFFSILLTHENSLPLTHLTFRDSGFYLCCNIYPFNETSNSVILVLTTSFITDHSITVQAGRIGIITN